MSSTFYYPIPSDRDSFVFGNVESLMAELWQGSGLPTIYIDNAPAGQDASHYSQGRPPPLYIPEEDATPHFAGDVGDWVLPLPPREAHHDSPFETTKFYEHPQDSSSFGASPLASPADLFSSTSPVRKPFASTLSFTSTQLSFSNGLADMKDSSLSPSMSAALLSHSFHLPLAFVQPSPNSLSASSLQPPFLNSPPQSQPATPSISSVDSPASSDVSNGTSSSVASSKRSSQSSRSSSRHHHHTHEYLPSIRFAAARRNQGVLCAQTYVCKWGNCTELIQLEGANKAAEVAFHRAVEKHIDHHASLYEHDGRRVCYWDGECATTGQYKEKRTMARHIKTHIPWRYFCQYCNGTYGRERKQHLRACEAYGEKKAAGEAIE